MMVLNIIGTCVCLVSLCLLVAFACYDCWLSIRLKEYAVKGCEVVENACKYKEN